MFNSDNPIRSISEDLLGRTSFAQSLRDALLSYKDKNSIVVGLFGAWGSGKTSLLNLIEEGLVKSSEKYTTEPIIIRFNPWNFSEQNQLIFQFFNSLSHTLKRKDDSKLLQNIGDKIDIFSTIFNQLNY